MDIPTPPSPEDLLVKLDRSATAEVHQAAALSRGGSSDPIEFIKRALAFATVIVQAQAHGHVVKIHLPNGETEDLPIL